MSAPHLSEGRRLSPLEWLLLLVVGSLVLSMFFPVFAYSGPGPPCQQNLIHLGLSMVMYAEDNDERLPVAVWMDSLHPYSREEAVLHCPSVSDGKAQSYGYAMTRDLLGTKLSELKSPKPMLFDSIVLGRNAVGGPWLLPNPGRHKEQNFVATTDGIAKGVRNPLPTGRRE